MTDITDIHGETLDEGDQVYFTVYGDEWIREGKIKKFTGKNVMVEDNQGWYKARISHSRAKHRIIKRKI